MKTKLKTVTHFTILLDTPIRLSEGKTLMDALQSTLQQKCSESGTLSSEYGQWEFEPIKKESE